VLRRIDDWEAMQIEAGVENDLFSRHLAIILDETVVTRIMTCQHLYTVARGVSN
jgi:hypothetical protein